MSKRFILVVGFYASGSSAVTDLLKEYDDFYECQAEIRMFKDPYGIINLENNLVKDWDWIRSTFSIKHFLEYSKKCSRKKSNFIFSPFGMGYKKNINSKYNEITKDYINNLTKYHYKKDYYFNKAYKKYPIYVIDRFKIGLEKLSKGKIKSSAAYHCYFSTPTKEEFYTYTKKYIDTLFDNKKEYNIILDQALMPGDCDKVTNYFSNGKMIIVFRDPRDMYCDVLKTNELGGAVDKTINGGKYFVANQKKLREKISENENVLFVQFENLVLNYDATVSKIENFLNIDSRDHLNKFKYLIPDKSKKNIGIWKEFYEEYKGALDYIASEMSDSLYND